MAHSYKVKKSFSCIFLWFLYVGCIIGYLSEEGKVFWCYLCQFKYFLLQNSLFLIKSFLFLWSSISVLWSFIIIFISLSVLLSNMCKYFFWTKLIVLKQHFRGDNSWRFKKARSFWWYIRKFFQSFLYVVSCSWRRILIHRRLFSLFSFFL